MLEVGNYVTRKHEDNPTGIVLSVYGSIDATVRWGVADGNEYIEVLPQADLKLVTHHIYNKEGDEPEVVHNNVFEGEDSSQ